MSNQQEIRDLMIYYTEKKPIADFIERLGKSVENTRVIASISANTTWIEDDKKIALIASRYLNSVGKGENALELSYNLIVNLEKRGKPDYNEFIVPEYIKQIIKLICL